MNDTCEGMNLPTSPN